MVAKPSEESSTNKYVRLSLSISVALNAISIDTSSSVWDDTSSAIGASLTGFTVTVISCESERSPSVADTVNISLPLKFVVAVNVISLPSSTAIISLPPAML